MGQIKNIKLHIVTDIKRLSLPHTPFTKTKWLTFPPLNLRACTAHSYYTMTTSTSQLKRSQRLSVRPKSTLKRSGRVSSLKLSKDAILEISYATSDLLQLLEELLHPLRVVMLRPIQP